MQRHILALTAAGILGATGVLSSAGSASAARAPSIAPKRLVLSTGDLPGKFRLQSSRPLSRAEAATINSLPGDAIQHGYASSYETSFTRDFSSYRSPSQARGLLTVVDDVLLYRTAAGAHAILRSARKIVRSTVKRNKKDHFVSFGAAGNERVGYQAAEKATRGTVLESDVLIFRDGKYVIAVIATGLVSRGGGTNRAVATLARIIAHRISG